MAVNDKTQTELQGFPSEFATTEKKKEDKFGLQYAKAIYSRYRIEGSYSDQVDRFKLLRKYAEGLQPMDMYKDLVDSDGDTSAMNLDYTIVPILPKYVDIMVGEMINEDYKIRLDSIDKISTDKKDVERKKLMADIFLKPIMQKISDVSGIKIKKPDASAPQSKEEVELHMQLNFRLATEIDMEKSIEFVYLNSDWEEIKKRVYRDFVVLKRGWIKLYYDENANIRLKYVDPVRLITPYTDRPDFSNIKYAATIEKYSIAEIRRKGKGKLKEADLFELAEKNAGSHGNRSWDYNQEYGSYYDTNMGNSQYDDYLISCVEFEYLSISKSRHEKKKNNHSSFFVNKKSSDYQIPEGKEEGRELLEDEWEHTYEGIWAIGSEIMVDYGMTKNIRRPRTDSGYSKNTSLSYIGYAPNIYDMENKSHVERMMPHADQVQLTHLKEQQLLARVAPPGVAVDVAALREINIGSGRESSSPLELLELYRQTGVFFYEGIDDDGQPMNRKPVDEIPNSSGNVLAQLQQNYAFHVQMIRDVTGLNEARDASSENKRAGLGLEEMRVKLSRNATMPLTDGFLNVYRRSAEIATTMIQDTIELYGETTALRSVLGEMGIKNIKLGKDHAMCQYGIAVETVMDEEEKAQLERDISLCLANGSLEIEDAILIRSIKNYKIASQFLIVRKKLKREADMREAQANSQMNAQVAEQAAMAKMQADSQVAQTEGAIKAQLLAQEIQGKIELEKVKHENKMAELAIGGEFKSRHIQEASDEDFKRTTLSESISQPKVFAGAGLSKTKNKTVSS